AVYVPFNGAIPSPKIIDTLRPIFENPAIGKGGQNVKYDALMLHQHGIHLKGITFDTLIAAFLVIPGGRQLNLDALAQSLLGYQMISIENLIGPKGKKQLSMAEVEVEDVSRYACEDADITLQLVKVLSEKLDETETRHLFETVEMPLVSVLLEMEKTGVKLDTGFLAEMSVTLGEDIERLEKEIHEAAGESFNTNSTQQLAGILFEKLEIHKALGKRPPKKTKTGKYSTSESELLKYEAHPLVHQILEYRKLAKLKSTYVDALPQLIAARDGRLHTSFNQTVAATGRLSSHDPNLQNIPIRGERGREIRKAFIPADGDKLILSADYSQVELRIMAHISGDDGLREAFENGEDIHSSTAAAIFGIPMEAVEADHRRKAKEVNFGIIYGISRFGLAGRLGIKADEAEQIILSYFSRYPKVNNYIADTIRQAMADGYVTTMLNRRRYIPDLLSQNQNIRQNAERVAINTPIQGSAADLIKIAMINIQKALEAGQHQAKMILQVHDELVFEVPRAELAAVKELVIREMEGAMDLKVPLKVDCGSGDNWMEAH
ncbi:MAG TPA: DNA polymerase I, partial [Calditrichia bacterium]|nr:DNA polymerase I [Calditrichia bacterium]